MHNDSLGGHNISPGCPNLQCFMIIRLHCVGVARILSLLTASCTSFPFGDVYLTSNRAATVKFNYKESLVPHAFCEGEVKLTLLEMYRILTIIAATQPPGGPTRTSTSSFCASS